MPTSYIVEKPASISTAAVKRKAEQQHTYAPYVPHIRTYLTVVRTCATYSLSRRCCASARQSITEFPIGVGQAKDTEDVAKKSKTEAIVIVKD